MRIILVLALVATFMATSHARSIVAGILMSEFCFYLNLIFYPTLG